MYVLRTFDLRSQQGCEFLSRSLLPRAELGLAPQIHRYSLAYPQPLPLESQGCDGRGEQASRVLVACIASVALHHSQKTEDVLFIQLTWLPPCLHMIPGLRFHRSEKLAPLNSHPRSSGDPNNMHFSRTVSNADSKLMHQKCLR